MRLLVASCLLLVAAPKSAAAEADLESSVASMARDLAGVMKSKAVKKLAVVDFSDIRGYPSALDAFLAEELITQLMIAAPGDFSIVERRQLSRILEEQKLTSSALFDQEAIANVGKILGLDAIVTGTIADLGGEIKINARSIAIETAQVFAAASIKVPKEGAVAELLRQSAGPDRGLGAPAAPAERQVQASDVFFENKLVRVQVASVGVTSARDRVTIALQIENVSATELKLSLLERGGNWGYCATGITDELGNDAQVNEHKVSGVSCTSDRRLSGDDRYWGAQTARPAVDEGWPSLAPRSRTTIVLPFERRSRGGFSEGGQPFGRIFSLASELLVSQRGRIEVVSVGLSNIVAPAESAAP